MQYNAALDGLRALSVLAVVSFHCATPGASGGFVGVDVFFVLSGYLITAMLAEEYCNGGIKPARFYARRALRLYPTLLLLLVVYVALAPILFPSDARWLSALLSGFYFMDYGLPFGQVASSIGHTWSLGVEEKFYLLWPLLLPLLLRTRRPVAWLFAAFIADTAWRYFVALKWGWVQAYFCFDTRMSGILLGAIAALMRPEISRLTVIVACATLAIIVAVPIIPTTTRSIPIEGVTLGITLAEISAFVLICHVAKHGDRGLLASRPLVYTGRLSYGIYLWHFPLVILLRDVHSQPWWITLSWTLLFSFAISAICLHFVDEPLKQWRTQHLPMRRAVAA